MRVELIPQLLLGGSQTTLKMPLGFEVSNEIPNLIARSGDYAANQLIETGRTIQATLLRNQAFRETRQLGEQLSQINPTSDDYPQAAAAIVSQHPLAIQTGLAKMVLEPGMKAYAAAQAAKRTDALIKGRADLHGGGNQPVYTGGPRPTFGNVDEDPLNPKLPQNQSITGVLQNTFGTMKGDEPQAELAPLPGGDVPDAASAMRKKVRPLQDYIREYSTTYNDALAAGKRPPFSPAQISANAARQKAADDKEIAAATKANAPATDLHESTVIPGVMLTPKGTPFVKTEGGGIAHPASEYTQERIQQGKEAIKTRLERAVKTDIAKAANAEYLARKKDFETADTLLHRLEQTARKDAENPTLQAQVQEQQQRAEAAKQAREAALSKYQDVLKTEAQKLPEDEKPLTKAEAEKLPPGTTFRGTDGRIYTRH